MALQGTLRDFSLADIFQLIGLQRKTGLLTLTGPKDTVTILFEEGRIVGADSRAKHLEDRLGRVLLKTGKISSSQLDQVLKIQRETGQRLGDLLRATAALTEEDLGRALQLQITQILYRLFRWPSGEFRFAQSPEVEYDRQHFSPIPVENILMEGLRILDEWPLIEKHVSSLEMVFSRTDPDRMVRTADSEPQDAEPPSEEESPPPALELTEEQEGTDIVIVSGNQATAYHLLDGIRTVQDIIDGSELGEFETCKAIFQLLEKDLVGRARIRKDGEQPQERGSARMDRALATGTVLLAATSILAGILLGPRPWTAALLAPAGLHRPARTLRLAASQSRLTHLEYLVQLYTLRKEAFPQSLQDLTVEGLADKSDLLDPWGKPYRYLRTSRNYQIRGLDGDGKERPDLIRTGKIVLRGSRPEAAPRPRAELERPFHEGS